MPSYNNLEKLKTCIFSIMMQRFTDYEVWIIDGASTDGTQEYLKTLGQRFNFISEEDSGIYHAMNKGIEKSKGEWLYFLGADDKFSSNQTLLLCFMLREFANEKLLIGNVQYSNEIKFISSFTSKLWFKNTVHHQSVFYKRELFDNVRYDENYKVLADYHLNLQLFKQGIAYKKIDSIVAVCGGEGISKNYNWNLYREEIQLKTALTSIFIKPIFYTLGISKYFFRRVF
ncbi:glycosyltransferase family 2 protein [Tenacibaculum sp. MEBiC07804]|uniref:glycosyltransferase family 2 protein n=1 Tax=Tenacibaculum sp. MEBiC07804 TaxID=3412025 RepID=UPI003BA59EF2